MMIGDNRYATEPEVDQHRRELSLRRRRTGADIQKYTDENMNGKHRRMSVVNEFMNERDIVIPQSGVSWNHPNDRELLLRAKIERGWSSHRQLSNGERSCKDTITEDEMILVRDVIKRAEELQRNEMARIEKLAATFDSIKGTNMGDGVTNCLVCGVKKAFLRVKLYKCKKCNTLVCVRCKVVNKENSFCAPCHGKHMLWMRSGAWFYNYIPIFGKKEATIDKEDCGDKIDVDEDTCSILSYSEDDDKEWVDKNVVPHPTPDPEIPKQKRKKGSLRKFSVAAIRHTLRKKSMIKSPSQILRKESDWRTSGSEAPQTTDKVKELHRQISSPLLVPPLPRIEKTAPPRRIHSISYMTSQKPKYPKSRESMHDGYRSVSSAESSLSFARLELPHQSLSTSSLERISSYSTKIDSSMNLNRSAASDSPCPRLSSLALNKSPMWKRIETLSLSSIGSSQSLCKPIKFLQTKTSANSNTTSLDRCTMTTCGNDVPLWQSETTDDNTFVMDSPELVRSDSVANMLKEKKLFNSCTSLGDIDRLSSSSIEYSGTLTDSTSTSDAAATGQMRSNRPSVMDSRIKSLDSQSISSHGDKTNSIVTSESHGSTDSEENGTNQGKIPGKYGSINFTLQYDTKTQTLLAIVAACKGLRTPNKGTLPSCFIQTTLLPLSSKTSKSSRVRTPLVKKSLNPVFNYTLIYRGISPTDIRDKGMKMSVIDATNFKNFVIGEICFRLGVLTTRSAQQLVKDLKSKGKEKLLSLPPVITGTDNGRLELSLHYLSDRSTLVVTVVRCVRLRGMDVNGYSNPYIKCYLLPDPHARSKQRTVVKKKDLHPEFNQQFRYSVSTEELREKSLCVSVWHQSIARNSSLIGGLNISLQSSGEEFNHWYETLKTPDRNITKWYYLTENLVIDKKGERKISYDNSFITTDNVVSSN